MEFVVKGFLYSFYGKGRTPVHKHLVDLGEHISVLYSFPVEGGEGVPIEGTAFHRLHNKDAEGNDVMPTLAFKKVKGVKTAVYTNTEVEISLPKKVAAGTKVILGNTGKSFYLDEPVLSKDQMSHKRRVEAFAAKLDAFVLIGAITEEERKALIMKQLNASITL